MPQLSSELERQIKKAAKTGKYIVGRKEVLSSLKGSKLLVWSASANLSPKILEQCKSLGIPALKFDGDPIALGKMCGIPFKVSVIALRSAGDANLEPFLESRDYSFSSGDISTGPVATPIEAQDEVTEKNKRSKKAEVYSEKTPSVEEEGKKVSVSESKKKTTRKKVTRKKDKAEKEEQGTE